MGLEHDCPKRSRINDSKDWANLTDYLLTQLQTDKVGKSWNLRRKRTRKQQQTNNYKNHDYNRVLYCLALSFPEWAFMRNVSDRKWPFVRPSNVRPMSLELGSGTVSRPLCAQPTCLLNGSNGHWRRFCLFETVARLWLFCLRRAGYNFLDIQTYIVPYIKLW